MNVKKYIIIVLCVIGVCLAILSGVIVAFRMVGPFGNGGDIEGIEVKTPKDRVNIVILGADGSESRSDTIMVASLDNKNKKLSILSIPRDTRVLDGKQYDKITHLYSGPKKEQATIAAIKRITGIPIHYYVIVDFKGFRDSIDALGGVYITVPNIPNKFSAGRRGMYYSDPVQKLDIKLKEGYQLLDGKSAEGYVRFRDGYPDADLGRIKVQQDFVKELLSQKLQPQYLLKAPDIFKKISNNVKTNYGVLDMTSHLMTIKALNPDNIKTFQLPGHPEQASTRYGVLSCFIYDQEKTDQIIRENFMSSSAASPSPTQKK